ncbi:MAG: hypothetical protein R3300_00550 [Candidatus Promineifilaceae bacterium]|nr:hypothetical protein [Candidatus Promineifilaceae bacterium]
MALALGIASAYLLPDEIAATAATAAGAGLTLLPGGGLTLAVYLRRHPEAGMDVSA